MKKVSLVNLSNQDQAKTRNNSGAKHTYTEDYRGLDPVLRAKKAALAASDNGRCWWVYTKIYGDLVHRFDNERKKR